MSEEPTMVKCLGCGARLRLKPTTRSYQCPRCQEPGIVQDDPAPLTRKSEPASTCFIPKTMAPESTSAVDDAVRPVEPNSIVVNEPIKTSIPAPNRYFRAVFGALAGLVLMMGLSFLQPVIGFAGMATGFGLAAATLLVFGILRRTIARTLLATLGESHPDVVAIRARETAHLRFSMAFLLLGATFFLFDRAGVEGKGRLQKLVESMPKSAFQPPRAVAMEPIRLAGPPPIDEKPWASADYVVLTPGNEAIALDRQEKDGRPNFAVLARADRNTFSQAVRAAWEHQRPIVSEHSDIVKLIDQQAVPGATLRSSTSYRLVEALSPPRFTPEKASLVRFHDLRQSRRRVGHLIQQETERFQFADLIPTRSDVPSSSPTSEPPKFKTELISERMIQPGSFQMLQAESDLRSSVDFLDFCILQVLKTLESRSEITPVLFVDHVAVDAELKSTFAEAKERRVERSKRIDSTLDAGIQAEIQQVLIRESRPRELLDLLNDMLSKRSKERLKDNTSSAQALAQTEAEIGRLNDEIADCRLLLDEQNRFTSEIRSHLSKAGLPQIEAAASLEKARQSAGSWRRPDFEEAQKTGLIGATHVLLTDIRKPDHQGRYQLSMRLVDLISGRILWEDQGDRFDLSKQSLELAAPAFLLNTGELVLVRFPQDIKPFPTEQTAGLLGGWPLRLPEIDAFQPKPVDEREVKKKKDTPALIARIPQPSRRNPRATIAVPLPEPPPSDPPGGLDVLLGYREETGGKRGFRDLFSWSLQPFDKLTVLNMANARVPIPANRINWSPISSATEVPDAHMMRYVVWRLARAILPSAGRIESINGSEVSLDLGRDHGVKTADTLTVLRPNTLDPKNAKATVSVVPVKLILREVHENGSIAVIDETDSRFRSPGLAALPAPRAGDLVHRQLDREIHVAVLNPIVDLHSVSPATLKQYGESNVHDSMDYQGRRVAELLQSALIAQRVKVVDRKDLEAIQREQRLAASDPHTAAQVGRIKNATHVIVGTIAPSPRLNYRAPMTLKVVDVATAEVVAQIDFECTFQQVEKWRP
jgi:predicted RNA-binding Zn-ribbon protein involved in translation (DUF1610 family)